MLVKFTRALGADIFNPLQRVEVMFTRNSFVSLPDVPHQKYFTPPLITFSKFSCGDVAFILLGN